MVFCSITGRGGCQALNLPYLQPENRVSSCAYE
jgi:hypothetical protein